MQRAARSDFTSLKAIIQRIQPLVRAKDDLLTVHKKYDALYKGILNLINFHTGGYLSLENSSPVSMMSNLEDHHIYPKDYLRRNWSEVHQTLDSEIAIDCVINRTLIPKLTNIKVSNKAPSLYLGELSRRNAQLPRALASHLLSTELLSGDYDSAYDFFLDERAGLIMEAIDRSVLQVRSAFLEETVPVLGTRAG